MLGPGELLKLFEFECCTCLKDDDGVDSLPHLSSGSPITAHVAIAGCFEMTFSTSIE